jgi:parvulin-like peptidyl-prolyl isomerase
MKAGQVSGVIASRAGFHILRVNGCRASTQMTFAQVKNTIKKSLYKEREARLRHDFEQALRSKAKIEVL